jgi:hypothetical protein
MRMSIRPRGLGVLNLIERVEAVAGFLTEILRCEDIPMNSRLSRYRRRPEWFPFRPADSSGSAPADLSATPPLSGIKH